jgi:hypothetical protein
MKEPWLKAKNHDYSKRQRKAGQMARDLAEEMGLAEQPQGLSRQERRNWQRGVLQALKIVGVNLMEDKYANS